MIMRHWISCQAWTVEVHTNPQGYIVWTAPLAKRFRGQQLDSLLAWAKGFSGVRHVVMGVANE